METNDIKHPAFLRLPKCGERCALTGLSRSMLNALILPTAANNFMPPVVSHVVKSDPQSMVNLRNSSCQLSLALAPPATLDAFNHACHCFGMGRICSK